MSLLGLLVAIIVFACLYIVVTKLPIDASIKRVVIIVLLVVAALVLLWLLLGLLGAPLNTRVP